MQPNINELRDIRNSYYRNNTYERNRRNNSERIRNRRNNYYYESSESNDDENGDDFYYNYENINSNYYNRNYYNNRNYNNRNYYNSRRNNSLFSRIEKILNRLFFRDENVIYAILLINIAVHVLWEAGHYNKEMYYDSQLLNFMSKHFTVSWTNSVRKKRYWTFITAMFSHEDIYHLAANMASFYSFSLPVIKCIGKKKFIASYLLSGIGCALAHVLFYHSVAPKLSRTSSRTIIFDLLFSRTVKNSYNDISSLGASGAITGINTIFACLYPTELITYNNYLRLPAWLTMSLFIFGDFYRSVTLTNGNIDTIGHVGGGVTGYLYYLHYLKPYIYRYH